MGKTEMTAKEENTSSKLSVCTTTVSAVTTRHPRQAQIRCDINIESEFPSQTLISGHRYCSRFPCFGLRRRTTTRSRVHLGGSTILSSSSSYSSLWDKIQTAENQHKWWAGPIKAFMKLREWSEIVAGRNWKTFIRRFNRNGCKCLNYPNQGTCTKSNTVFQYDPLSYALNFDEGIHGRNNDQFSEEDIGYYPDFTSRYVKVSVHSNSINDNAKSAAVLDLGKNSRNTAPAG